MSKVNYTRFPLTKQAGRIALLTGLTAGTVSREEVETAVLVDTEKRPYRKPVMAHGVRYNSVTEAAAALCHPRATLNQLKGAQQYIRRACNNDYVGKAHPDFYWSK